MKLMLSRTILIFVVLTLILASLFIIPPKGYVSAVPGSSGPCINVNPRLEGLLSTPNLVTPSQPGQGGGFGSSSGQCVTSTNGNPLYQAGIISFKIPTYDQLKNTYFERKNSTNGPNAIDKRVIAGNQTDLNFRGGNGNKLWDITGNLTLTQCPDGPGLACSSNRSAVIFVDGDLKIGDLNASANPSPESNLDIRYDNPTAGIVYVVKGNVLFGRNVHRFDGVIIDQGTICTSVDNNNFCQSDEHANNDNGGETKQLIINGNLISLDATKPIQFERNLTFSVVAFPGGNDTTPAEVINVQPKYMVVMKDLFSDLYTIQTEDTSFALNQ